MLGAGPSRAAVAVIIVLLVGMPVLGGVFLALRLFLYWTCDAQTSGNLYQLTVCYGNSWDQIIWTVAVVGVAAVVAFLLRRHTRSQA